MKNLAQDLVNVFPINEFAIRSFSSQITPYPASGEFVGESGARDAIESMAYDNGITYTGEALEQTISLLEDKTYICIIQQKLPQINVVAIKGLYSVGMALCRR